MRVPGGAVHVDQGVGTVELEPVVRGDAGAAVLVAAGGRTGEEPGRVAGPAPGKDPLGKGS
jgi:hypothetical protein